MIARSLRMANGEKGKQRFIPLLLLIIFPEIKITLASQCYII